MRDTDADEVADEVAIMEVVPKEDLEREARSRRSGRESGADGCFDSLQLRAFVLAGATPGDAVDLDEGPRRSATRAGEQSDGVAVSILRRVEVWVDQHDRVGVAKHEVKPGAVCCKCPTQAQ
jgi:hypothetical protein